mmetsp:Transcript_14010/g.23001  ORF Transcript_14010/g.23001 Transcript_14010/m.23001 type:complete len:97 (+) Transcript_14010:152-442(+)
MADTRPQRSPNKDLLDESKLETRNCPVRYRTLLSPPESVYVVATPPRKHNSTPMILPFVTSSSPNLEQVANPNAKIDPIEAQTVLLAIDVHSNDMA